MSCAARLSQNRARHSASSIWWRDSTSVLDASAAATGNARDTYVGLHRVDELPPLDRPGRLAVGHLGALGVTECLDEMEALRRSDERSHAIADAGRLLETLLVRQLHHLVVQQLDHTMRMAGECRRSVFDRSGVVRCIGGAGARAVCDAELRRAARSGVGGRREGPADSCRTAPEGHRALDRLDHEVGHRPRRQRAEVHAAGGRVLHDRETWPRGVDVETDVAVAVDAGAGTVVAGEEPGDQSALDHLGGERIGEVEMRDRLRLAQHRADLAAVVAAEVRANSLAQVRGLADVQHVVALASEHVDAGRAGQVGGHLELCGLRMAGELGERHEVVEAEDAEARRPLDEQVEEVGGRERIVECSVARLVVETESGGERAEATVGDLVANEATRERDGVDHGARQRRAAVTFTGGSEEADVEADVVAHDHGVADELDERRQHRTDAWRGRHQDVGQPGEHGDLRAGSHGPGSPVSGRCRGTGRPAPSRRRPR